MIVSTVLYFLLYINVKRVFVKEPHFFFFQAVVKKTLSIFQRVIFFSSVTSGDALTYG